MTTLRIDPTLAGLPKARRITLQAQVDPVASVTVPAAELRAGIKTALAAGQARYWRVTPLVVTGEAWSERQVVHSD